jgi:hypothetical protein
MRLEIYSVTDKDTRVVLKKVIEQGGVISRRGSGHIMVIPRQKDKPCVFMPSTPSDLRSIKNLVGKLRRAGFII